MVTLSSYSESNSGKRIVLFQLPFIIQSIHFLRDEERIRDETYVGEGGIEDEMESLSLPTAASLHHAVVRELHQPSVKRVLDLSLKECVHERREKGIAIQIYLHEQRVLVLVQVFEVDVVGASSSSRDRDLN